MQFDPLIARNWLSVTQDDIKKAVSIRIRILTEGVTIILKGGRGILEHHSGSHIQALVELYPELKLEKKMFLNYQGICHFDMK
jgi:hypothetical protein